jgi:sugar lactone lactonase YvrE
MGVYDGTWTFLSEAEGLPDYAAEDFAFAPDGKGWFATPSGACYFTETPTGIRLRRMPAPATKLQVPAVDILGRPAKERGVRLRVR